MDDKQLGQLIGMSEESVRKFRISAHAVKGTYNFYRQLEEFADEVATELKEDRTRLIKPIMLLLDNSLPTIREIDPTTLRAYGFAECAHVRQRRKYVDEPYITHCLNVARIVAGYINDVDVISAALLHDVVEDTNITNQELAEVFGYRIADLVSQVTDVSKLSNGNRKTRKQLDLNHLAVSSSHGATIKLADIIDNVSNLVDRDPQFAQVFLVEKHNSLEVLKHGNTELWRRAHGAVVAAFDSLDRIVQ